MGNDLRFRLGNNVADESARVRTAALRGILHRKPRFLAASKQVTRAATLVFAFVVVIVIVVVAVAVAVAAAPNGAQCGEPGTLLGLLRGRRGRASVLRCGSTIEGPRPGVCGRRGFGRRLLVILLAIGDVEVVAGLLEVPAAGCEVLLGLGRVSDEVREGWQETSVPDRQTCPSARPSG